MTGSGSLQHLGDDRWRVRLYVGKNSNGRQATRSRSFRAPTPRAARKLASQVTAALQDEIDKGVAQRGTVAELAADWLALKRQQGRSPTTIHGYEIMARRIVARFGRLPVDQLDGRAIDRWYGELIDGGMGVNTVHHHHAALRAMLRQGERWGHLDLVATRRASPPATNRVDLAIPSDDVMRVLLAGASGHFACALRVLAGTGMRRGELCGLAWSDLDGHTLTIRRSVVEVKQAKVAGRRQPAALVAKSTKGRRSRAIDVDADVVAAFAEMRADLEVLAAKRGERLVDDGPVFADIVADATGRRPRAPSWASHRWDLLAGELGVDFRLHDVRHWHATMLLRAGVPIQDVSHRLGHAQVSTTLNIYAHAMRGTNDRVLGALASFRALPSAATVPPHA